MNKLTQEQLTLLLKAAIQMSLDAALALAKLFKGGATIDEAIAALEEAKTKTAQQYKDEDAGIPVLNMPVDPTKDMPH